MKIGWRGMQPLTVVMDKEGRIGTVVKRGSKYLHVELQQVSPNKKPKTLKFKITDGGYGFAPTVEGLKVVTYAPGWEYRSTGR